MPYLLSALAHPCAPALADKPPVAHRGKARTFARAWHTQLPTRFIGHSMKDLRYKIARRQSRTLSQGSAGNAEPQLGPSPTAGKGRWAELGFGVSSMRSHWMKEVFQPYGMASAVSCARLFKEKFRHGSNQGNSFLRVPLVSLLRPVLCDASAPVSTARPVAPKTR